jgi:hypothetical protein
LLDRGIAKRRIVPLRHGPASLLVSGVPQKNEATADEVRPKQRNTAILPERHISGEVGPLDVIGLPGPESVAVDRPEIHQNPEIGRAARERDRENGSDRSERDHTSGSVDVANSTGNAGLNEPDERGIRRGCSAPLLRMDHHGLADVRHAAGIRQLQSSI